MSIYCAMIQTVRGHFLVSFSSISIQRFSRKSTRFVRGTVAIPYRESTDESKGSQMSFLIRIAPKHEGYDI